MKNSIEKDTSVALPKPGDVAPPPSPSEVSSHPTAAIVFLPTFGGSVLKHKDAVIWPPNSDTIKEVLIQVVGNVLLKLLQDRNFSKLTNFVSMIENGIINLYDELVSTWDIDISKLELIPPELVSVLGSNDVVPSGEVIRDIIHTDIFPNFKKDLYGLFFEKLENLGFKEQYNLFPVGYDFRRDPSFGASELNEFFERSKNLFAKNNIEDIILLGHGSGGLVAREFMSNHTDSYAWGKVKMLVNCGSPVHGSVTAAVCSAGLGRRLFTAPSTMRTLARKWEGVGAILPDLVDIKVYDRDTCKRLDVNDVVDFVGLDRSSIRKRKPITKLDIPVVNMAGLVENTPIFMNNDSVTGFKNVVYGPGDGLVHANEVFVDDEINVTVRSGHMGLMFEIVQVFEAIVGRKSFSDINFVNVEDAFEKLEEFGKRMRKEIDV